MNLERVQKYYELIDRELGLESVEDLFGFESDEEDLFGFESEEDDLFGFESEEIATENVLNRFSGLVPFGADTREGLDCIFGLQISMWSGKFGVAKSSRMVMRMLSETLKAIEAGRPIRPQGRNLNIADLLRAMKAKGMSNADILKSAKRWITIDSKLNTNVDSVSN